jgi:mRNA interferase RelE/StbE
VGDYSIEVKRSAWKELDALPDNMLARVLRKMETLRIAPRPPGCKKLRGYKDQWRVRVGDWRVVYVIDDAAKLVSITRIAHRREAYER